MCYPLLKIIWNITKKCGYDCEICATSSNRDELSFDEKNSVLESILSIGTHNISELDFSGGDPLFDTDSIKIVKRAIDVLSKDKISVTTTGKGISNIISKGEDLHRLLYNCEVTIDCIDHIPNYLRKDTSYISTNRNALDDVAEKISNITINIPILHPEMTDDSICKLVDAIAKININVISVNLIRLMSVGRMSTTTYPYVCSPERFIETFVKYAKNTCIKNVHIHCAFRGKILGNQCNMLKNKVGVDCSGNVFACAWGGYIKEFDKNNICENPFYIGNLLEMPLSEILKNKYATRLKELIKENPTRHCRVYCYRNSNSNDIFDDMDPLFTNHN